MATSKDKYLKNLMQKIKLGLDVDAMIDIATDILYLHLFGMDSDGLRRHFKLPKSASDQQIRDCMGDFALGTLSILELNLGKLFDEIGIEGKRDMVLVVWHFAKETSANIHATTPKFSVDM